MQLEEFLSKYCCKLELSNKENFTLTAVSKAVRRTDNKEMDSVTTKINIPDANHWIDDSQTLVSVSPWDWNTLLEQLKRGHLACFAERVPIDNYFPLNSSTDISNMYCEG